MEQGFIDILKKLVGEQGKTALTDAKKTKAFLADYTKNEYKKESRLLLQAVEAGVAKAIDGADELEPCKKAQIRELEEDHALATEVAADIVNTLALVLRGDTTVTVSPSAEKSDLSAERDQTKTVSEETVRTPITETSASLATTSATPSVESLMKRGNLFLEDSEWEQADDYYDMVLDADPEYAPAYIGKLCVELRIQKEEYLPIQVKVEAESDDNTKLASIKIKEQPALSDYKNYQKALRFADSNYRIKLEKYDQERKERLHQEEYNWLVRKKNIAYYENEYPVLAEQFRAMNGYINTDKLVSECVDKFNELREKREKKEREEKERNKKEYKKEALKEGILAVPLFIWCALPILLPALSVAMLILVAKKENEGIFILVVAIIIFVIPFFAWLINFRRIVILILAILVNFWLNKPDFTIADNIFSPDIISFFSNLVFCILGIFFSRKKWWGS
jgi:tetratricopeptide (TPR) repeat protein